MGEPRMTTFKLRDSDTVNLRVNFEVRSHGAVLDTVKRTRVRRHFGRMTTWFSVKYKGRDYELFGGVTVPDLFWIELGREIKGVGR